MQEIQYNTTHHISQNNTQYSRQLSILKFTIANTQRHLYYTVKSQKRVEPKVDESVLKAARNTKQSVNHGVLHSISHISPRHTRHSASLSLLTLHIPPRP